MSNHPRVLPDTQWQPGFREVRTPTEYRSINHPLSHDEALIQGLLAGRKRERTSPLVLFSIACVIVMIVIGVIR